MNKLYYLLALGLSLSIMVGSGEEVSAQSTDECFKYEQGQQQQAAESIRLYYLRKASTIKQILDKIVEKNSCLEGTVVENQEETTIILYGKKEQRKTLERIITVLDLPLESVNLEMWGILISSSSPQHLADVMRRVNREIDKTQLLLQYTYQKFEELAREQDREEDKIDDEYKYLLEKKLGYPEALNLNRPLSMTDILLRANAAKNPFKHRKAVAKKLCFLFREKEYIPYIKALKKENKKKRPFENYLQEALPVDLELEIDQNCEVSINKKRKDSAKEPKTEILRKNYSKRRVLLDFALQYSHLKQEPAKFDPQSLQRSAESLNSVLNPIVKAINRDIEELFIEPTLAEIQRIVRDCAEVDYAEVGKTSVQSLNGVESTVSSTTVSAFDEPVPLRLNELLEEAGKVNEFSQDLIPSSDGTNTVPASSVVSLIAALSKNRSTWREITSGVSMKIIPSVLRNSTSAELDIEFETGPQKDKETEISISGYGTEEVRPLSRISKNKVDTQVYVNTLEIFALSTFNSQTTEDGGRTYIPVIGTIWQGVFSGIPIIGNLFSWRNAPKSVQHQSIILTNSFIIPTAMGLAHLYKIEQPLYKIEQPEEHYLPSYDFNSLSSEVRSYQAQLKLIIEERLIENNFMENKIEN